MILDNIEGCKEPQASFIHVRGEFLDSNEQSDFVINVDKIDYIKRMNDEQTLISFSGILVVVDYDYYKFNECFLNNVNLLFHLNRD